MFGPFYVAEPLAGRGKGFLVEPLEDRTLLAHFAVIGDFTAGTPTKDVSSRIKSWSPEFVVTVGDNNYPDGAATTIDPNIGQYFQQYIYPYKGAYGPGSLDGTNHFWPAIGNHDWTPSGSIKPYTDYFTLPNNERYYTVQQGNVGIFVVDSDPHEPDGNTSSSVQGTWLRNALAASSAKWKFVFLHHPPYSSGSMGSNTFSQWPFAQWGANAVFSGHEHDYERISRDGIAYFVNGLGGDSRTSFGKTVTGSAVRYNSDYGAMLIDTSDSAATFKFITRTGQTIDSYTMSASAPTTSLSLIPAGATWKYLDKGTDAGTAWRASGFDDSTWKSGAAELGYGDGDEKTVVSYGSSASNKYVTTYFRKTFNVSDPSVITALNAQLVRDDGAAVYLNGTEVWRSNMPAGTIGYRTFASSALGAPEESTWYGQSISPALLKAGTNTIAVELHQSDATSSDVSFNFSLTAIAAGTPVTPTAPAAPSDLRATGISSSAINLAWTDNASNEAGFEIERGTDGVTFARVATTLNDTTSYTDSGLPASTQYYYRIRAVNTVGPSAYTAMASATTQAATATTTFVSDMAWLSSTNGWGPVERDTNVGGPNAGDGEPLKLNGVSYTKGLGAHAFSQVDIDLKGAYGSFLSDVGVDDHQTTSGSVVFQVFADGALIYQSPIMRPATTTQSVNVNVAGVNRLSLVVTNGGDDTVCDWADWASARLTSAVAAAGATSLTSTSSTTKKTSTTTIYSQLLK